MAIVVDPTVEKNTHHVRLYSGATEVGLILTDQAGTPNGKVARRPYPSTASVKMYSGEQEYSDAEPPYSPQAQKDWSGGRGSLFFDDDATRFLDSCRVTTQLEGKAFLGAQETYSRWHRNSNSDLPGHVVWQGLYNDDAPVTSNRYRSRSFVASATYTAEGIEAWVRKVGTPTGPLTAALYSNSGGAPDALIDSDTLAVASVTDILSLLHAFTISAALVSGTTYHLVFSGAAGDTDANHWEIALHTPQAGGMMSDDGVGWVATAGCPYYRVVDAEKPMTALFFDYKGQLYFAARYDDGSAGKIYRNGYRGLADSNAGDKSYLEDAAQSGWASWNTNWRVEIYDGAGAIERDNWRKVIGGDANSLEVSPDWSETHIASGPNATQYNVLGADTWALVASLTYPPIDVETTGEFAWIACGEDKDPLLARSVYRFQEYSDLTQWLYRSKAENLVQASYLKAIYDPVAGWLLHLVRNNDADDDVTVTRVMAPDDYNEQLVVVRPYASSSPNGFMTELADTLTDLVSDSFNRADGAIGKTDGLATGGHNQPSGDGIAWTDVTGTIAIVSKAAKCTGLDAGRAIFTADSTEVDVAVQAYVTAASTGLLLRYVDADNYLAVSVTATHLDVTTRVATVETNVLHQAITYAAGALLKAEIAGTRLRVYYNGAQVGGDVSITDLALQAGTKVGLACLSTNSIWDNFLCYSIATSVSVVQGAHSIIEVAPSFGTGIIATDIVPEQDWRRYSKLVLSIRSDTALAAGELQLLVSDTVLCGGVIGAPIDFPPLAADYFYGGADPDSTRTANVEFDFSAEPDAEHVISVGLNLASAPAAPLTLWVTFTWLVPDAEIIPVGDRSAKATGVERYGDPETLWVLKQDSLWEIRNNLAHKIPVHALEAVKSSDNGRAHLVHDVYLYFSLLDGGFERYHNQNIDDLGPNLGEGLPDGRRGRIAHAVDFPTGVIVACDAGEDGTSSVLFYNEKGWHELYRAPRSGLRIRRVHVQPIPGASIQRLWISQGSDVLWIPVSLNLNPKEPADFRYIHEGTLELARMAVKRQDIPKFWSSLKAITEQLSANTTILAQYKTDADSTWTSLPSAFTSSPSEEIDFSAANDVDGKWMQVRLVFRTNDNEMTPVLHSLVAEPMVCEPVKYAYDLTFRIADRDIDLQGAMEAGTMAAKLAQLETWAASPLPVQMRCFDPSYDGKWVKLQPSSLRHWKHYWETTAGDVVNGEIVQMTLLEV